MTRSQRTLLILLAVILVLAAAAVGYALLASRATPAVVGDLPTLAVLPTATTTLTPTVTITPIPATSTATPSAIPSFTSTPPPLATATDEPTVTVTDSLLLTQQSRIQAAIDQTATALASITPTIGASPTELPPLGTLPPASDGSGENTAGGEQGTALNIGSGDLYVIAFSRPAETVIAELGGVVDAAPSGQTWALLEMLLVCAGSDNCAPESVALIGSSGATYTPAPISALPAFSSASYAMGQVYGYAGFIVPQSETAFSLSVTRGGQVFTIALRTL